MLLPTSAPAKNVVAFRKSESWKFKGKAVQEGTDAEERRSAAEKVFEEIVRWGVLTDMGAIYVELDCSDKKEEFRESRVRKLTTSSAKALEGYLRAWRRWVKFC